MECSHHTVPGETPAAAIEGEWRGRLQDYAEAAANSDVSLSAGGRSCISNPLRGGNSPWYHCDAECAGVSCCCRQVIMVVEDVEGRRILLGRRAKGKPGQFTALSGFVDAGESIEEVRARGLLFAEEPAS